MSGSLEYLVKWDGYDLMNATWEPKNPFDSEDTLRDWQEKKLQINYGKLPSFNVGKWEREKSRLEDEFSAAGKDMEENKPRIFVDVCGTSLTYFGAKKERHEATPEIAAYVRQHYQLIQQTE